MTSQAYVLHLLFPTLWITYPFSQWCPSTNRGFKFWCSLTIFPFMMNECVAQHKVDLQCVLFLLYFTSPIFPFRVTGSSFLRRLESTQVSPPNFHSSSLLYRVGSQLLRVSFEGCPWPALGTGFPLPLSPHNTQS